MTQIAPHSSGGAARSVCTVGLSPANGCLGGRGVGDLSGRGSPLVRAAVTCPASGQQYVLLPGPRFGPCLKIKRELIHAFLAPMIFDVTKGRDVTKAMRELRRIDSELSRERQIGADRFFDFRLLITLRALEQRRARAGRPRAALIFAGEIALRERRIGEQPDVLALGELGEPDLEGAVDEIVGVLDRDDARPWPSSAARRKRATPHGVSLDRPMWRTLPAFTSSASASSVSSIGISSRICRPR